MDAETGAEAMAECCYWLALHAFLSLLPYTIQDNLPTAVGWVLTPISIAPRASLQEIFFTVVVLLPR